MVLLKSFVGVTEVNHAMYLTKEEERIYDGELGWANQICMKILVRLGELFDATGLIPVNSAHVSGVSYKTLGDAPLDFLEALVDAGAKVKTKATLNPQSLDSEYICRRIPQNMRRKQSDILKCYEKMGFSRSLTCTPYYLEEPKRGSHIAWAESSAVVYANSVLRAWTNREGAPSALATAIIGKTPNYGVHKPENRQPQSLVKVEEPLQSEVEFGALGIFLGEILRDKIPIIEGIQSASRECLKQLGAALASSGMVNMFYYKDMDVQVKGIERISVGKAEIKGTIENLSITSTQKPDLIFLGCPHCSVNEIKQIADLIGNRKVKSDVEFWVCTSHHVKEKAKNHVKKVEKSGGHVLTDTCAVVTWTDMLKIKTIMTNSAKTAHYAPTLNKAETILAPLEDCLMTALEG
ncbi:MAG: aconitase X catalytic domain-containing protein [Candidatus Bathyarchaeia archaeon]